MHKSVREDFLHCFNHNFTNPQRFDADYQEHELLAPDRALVNAKDLVSSEKGMPYRSGINIPVSQTNPSLFFHPIRLKR